MSSPDLVNMMAFIRKGNPFPKSLDRRGKKGNVTTESLVGYSRYTSREDANDKANDSLDVTPGGYYKYTSERQGATLTFSHEGWIDSKDKMTTFRNYIASIWQDEDRLAWLPVQSYKDYMTASQYGLFKEEDYAQITKNSLNRFFKLVDLEPDNMVWWMNYHNNKNHPHVHVAFLEKVPTRDKGIFTENELKQYKRFLLTEMKERERMILGTDVAFTNHMKLLQSNKQVLQNRGKEIISNREEFEINKRILELFAKLPEKGRLQYGSSHMIPYRDELNEIVDLVLNHTKVRDEYENLMIEFQSLDDAYQSALNENITNMKDSETIKIKKVIANAILSQRKATVTNDHFIKPVDSKINQDTETENGLSERDGSLEPTPFSLDSVSDFTEAHKDVFNYVSSEYTNFQAKNSINSALSSIKRSDAEVKRIVREGLEEYLETDKEREGALYGQSI